MNISIVVRRDVWRTRNNQIWLATRESRCEKIASSYVDLYVDRMAA